VGTAPFEFSEMASQLEQPHKKYKSELKRTSPNDIVTIPPTPAFSPENNMVLEVSRLNTDFDVVDVIGTGGYNSYIE